jgi:hypothetical protein
MKYPLGGYFIITLCLRKGLRKEEMNRGGLKTK